MENPRSLYRLTGWISLILGVLALLYVLFLEENVILMLISFASFGTASVHFFVLVPETYKRREIHRYKRWHVIHGNMDEKIEIRFDERKIPLN